MTELCIASHSRSVVLPWSYQLTLFAANCYTDSPGPASFTAHLARPPAVKRLSDVITELAICAGVELTPDTRLSVVQRQCQWQWKTWQATVKDSTASRFVFAVSDCLRHTRASSRSASASASSSAPFDLEHAIRQVIEETERECRHEDDAAAERDAAAADADAEGDDEAAVEVDDPDADTVDAAEEIVAAGIR